MAKYFIFSSKGFFANLILCIFLTPLVIFSMTSCIKSEPTQPIETSPETTDNITQTSVSTVAPSYFDLNLSPVPDLENPGNLEVSFDMLEPDQYDNLENSRIDLEFYWTNIHGSYSEAKRAELIPIEEVLVSGETTWEGNTSTNPSITLHSQIKLPREGIWKIKAAFSTYEEVQLTEKLKVAVAEGTSGIMNTKEFSSNPLAYLANFSYGEVSEHYLDELHPVFIDLDISKAPRVGEEVVLTYRIESLDEVADFSTQFVVYKRTEGNAEERIPGDSIITAGSPAWTGDLVPGEPIIVTSTITFPEEGDWKIGVRRDQGIYFDYIWINVTNTRGSFGWEERKPPQNPDVTITVPGITIEH